MSMLRLSLVPWSALTVWAAVVAALMMMFLVRLRVSRSCTASPLLYTPVMTDGWW